VEPVSSTRYEKPPPGALDARFSKFARFPAQPTANNVHLHLP
jgi:hypothetical protein